MFSEQQGLQLSCGALQEIEAGSFPLMQGASLMVGGVLVCRQCRCG